MKNLLNWSEISRRLTGDRSRITAEYSRCIKKNKQLQEIVSEIRDFEKKLAKKIENYLQK